MIETLILHNNEGMIEIPIMHNSVGVNGTSIIDV